MIIALTFPFAKIFDISEQDLMDYKNESSILKMTNRFMGFTIKKEKLNM